MAKQRLKPKLTREEVNNQYVNSIFEEFIAEKKALGREADTLKAYQTSLDKGKHTRVWSAGGKNQIFHSNETRSPVTWTWERMMSATCRRSSKSIL